LSGKQAFTDLYFGVPSVASVFSAGSVQIGSGQDQSGHIIRQATAYENRR
jgi:hypothetical protein